MNGQPGRLDQWDDACSRRAVLRRLASVGAAAALRAAWPPAQGASAAGPAEWEQTVAAAKKEGKVAVNTFTGQGYGRVFKLFGAKVVDGGGPPGQIQTTDDGLRITAGEGAVAIDDVQPAGKPRMAAAEWLRGGGRGTERGGRRFT